MNKQTMVVVGVLVFTLAAVAVYVLMGKQAGSVKPYGEVKEQVKGDVQIKNEELLSETDIMKDDINLEDELKSIDSDISSL